MNRMIKILSALLAVLTVLGSMTVMTGAIPLYDEDGKKVDETGAVDYEVTMDQYLDNKTPLYTTPQERLAAMEMMWEKHGYQLWVDDVTGEVATVKVATGEIMFSNPWDTASAQYKDNKTGKNKTTSLAIKKQLLSQIVINYVDNDTEKTMYSCIEAAQRDQIDVEYIKNGIRVEYSIGREETRMLVPKLIERSRFEQKILKVMREYFTTESQYIVSSSPVKDEDGNSVPTQSPALWPQATVGQKYGYYELVLMHNPNFNMEGKLDLTLDIFQVKKVGAFYTLKDPDEATNDRERSAMESAFPITKKMPVYVIDPGVTTNEMTLIESYIKNYASTYTYEELDYDHELTEYVGVDKAPALFKLALEYSVDEQGMTVRLPANGIRFDESLYQITNIEMLPYMGAGSNDGDWTDGGDGYTFFPDGSGSLFDFEQLNNGKNKTVSGKVYGQDYAYHKITGTHQEVIRYPAFGIVENWTGDKTVTDYDKVVNKATYDDQGNLLTPTEYGTKKEKVQEDKGFLAIIEEGDALAELSTHHMSATSIYNTVKMIFYPRPKDSYNMADAISVGSNTVMTVVSKRKYVGNYKIRYVMLSDDNLAEEASLKSYYECSWMGMAVAYRDYLERNNVLTRLEKEDVSENIPLYIETFGALMTTDKFLSIPVDVMTPLTSFEDIKTMYTELSSAIESSMAELVAGGETVGTTEENAKNFNSINFKLTGYANGGMFSSVPYNLNWEAAVGGAGGFEELVEFAKEEGFGIFPDFDFVYINGTDNFDGVDLKEDAVKTIDNRYTSRREYSATYQTYVGYFQLAIAPSRFERFVTELSINYLKYNPTGISVSTLGTDLNSDFDEEDPLNREDSKNYTIEALRQLTRLRNEDGNALKIMTNGANAYTWRYIDYIVNMPLNSSRYNDSSNAVPFIGVVLHGYVQFAGTPINEEGDIEYAFLKAIENGASIYFTLSYQNTQELKESERLSKYFSVRYDIWKEDLVEMYTELNDLLCDLQTKLIIDHEFLTGSRVPDADEILSDEEALKKAEAEAEAIKQIEETKAALAAALKLRHTPTESVEIIENAINQINEQGITVAKYVAKIDSQFVLDCADIIAQANEASKALETAKKNAYSTSTYEGAIEAAKSHLNDAIIVATEAADRICAAAIANETDAAKVAAIKSVVNAVEEAIINAAIAVGAEEAFRQATNDEPTYASTALETAAALKEAAVVVNSVITAAAEASSDAKASAATEYAALVDGVADAILAGITKAYTAEVAVETVSATAKGYSNAVTANDKLIKATSDALMTVYNATLEAEALGANKDSITALSEIKVQIETLNNQITALNTEKNNYTNAARALASAAKKYFDEVKAIAVKAAGSDTALKTAVEKSIAFMSADYEAKIYELSYSIDKDLESNTKSTAEARRATADTALAELNKLDATVVANANTVIEQAKLELAAYADDCSAEYAAALAEINAYYDAVEELYVAAAGAEVELAEAVIISAESARMSAIKNLATKYANANLNFAAAKTLSVVTLEATAANNAKSALASTLRKSADDLIAKVKETDEYKAIVNKATSAKIDSAVVYNDYVAALVKRDALIDVYTEYANTINALNAELTDLNTAFENANVFSANKKAADEALNSAKTAFETAAANDDIKTSAKVISLLNAISAKRSNYDVVKAAYDLQKELVDSAFGSTTSEKNDLETKKKALDSAEKELNDAQAEYDAAYEACSCKTELQALVDAYNAQLAADSVLTKVNAIMTGQASYVKAVAALPLELSEVAEKDIIVVQLNSTISSASADYSSYLRTIKTAYTRVKTFYESAQNAVVEAEKATVQLDERRTTTKAAAAEAAVVARIYAAAVLLKNNTAEDLQDMLDKLNINPEATDAQKLACTDALAVVNATLDELKATLDGAAESAKETAEIYYNIKLAAEEKTADELAALEKSANDAKVKADREVVSAEQFYQTAVSETQAAKNKLADVKALYEENLALYNSTAMLRARTLLFGDSNMSSLITAANKDIKSSNDQIAALNESISIFNDQWAIIEKASVSYKESKEALDALLLQFETVGAAGMTAEELTAYRANRILYSYNIMVAETDMDNAIVAINDANTTFRKSYTSLNSTVNSLESTVIEIEAEAESARLLYEEFKNSADAADLKAKADEYAAIATEMRAAFTAIKAEFTENICPTGYEIGLLNVKDETLPKSEWTYSLVSSYDKHQNFVNETYGKVTTDGEKVEADKYTCDDGTIVAVVYGGKDGNDKDAYRTFLLNYNNFAVTVVYDGVEYVIPGYGYIVINN